MNDQQPASWLARSSNLVLQPSRKTLPPFAPMALKCSAWIVRVFA